MPLGGWGGLPSPGGWDLGLAALLPRLRLVDACPGAANRLDFALSFISTLASPRDPRSSLSGAPGDSDTGHMPLVGPTPATGPGGGRPWPASGPGPTPAPAPALVVTRNRRAGRGQFVQLQ